MKKSSFDLIVTHGGDAHVDDLMSVSLALALNPTATVQRVNAVHANVMSNPEALVLDIGGEDNGVNHFDHHQDNEGPCAFHRYATAMDYSGKDIYPGWAALSYGDCFGPANLAKELSCSTMVLTLTRSIPERVILSMFSGYQIIRPGEMMHETLLNMGREYIQYIEDIRNAQEALEMNTDIQIVDGLVIVIINIENEPLVGYDYYKRYRGMEVDVIVYPDQRADGWALQREVGVDPMRVSFNTWKNNPRMAFVHANGFFMTTKERVPRSELIDIIKQSVPDPMSY